MKIFTVGIEAASFNSMAIALTTGSLAGAYQKPPVFVPKIPPPICTIFFTKKKPLPHCFFHQKPRQSVSSPARPLWFLPKPPPFAPENPVVSFGFCWHGGGRFLVKKWGLFWLGFGAFVVRCGGLFGTIFAWGFVLKDQAVLVQIRFFFGKGWVLFKERGFFSERNGLFFGLGVWVFS